MKTLATISSAAPGAGPGDGISRADLEQLRSALDKLRSAKAMLVTGSGARKSTVAVGLATAAAASGRRVALLECDLAEPALARAQGLERAPGLNEYLRWEASAEQILQPLVLIGPAAGGASAPLVCIVAGEPTDRAATLLASESFTHAVEKLRHAYDLLVIDGPPLWRDDPALALAAARVDATLACVEASEARGKPKRAVKAALRRLAAPQPALVAMA